jgi:heat shock protein HtpX
MGRRYFNGVKTFGLLLGMWVLMLGLGMVIGDGQYIWLFGAGALLMNVFAYWNSGKMSIRAMQARPVTEVEQPAMYRIVRELSLQANQPMPQLFVSPTAAPNAFASGRNPRNAVVCCTEGILQILDQRELRGVLGHELMHVYNRDILVGSVAAASAGMITMIAQMLFFFGGGRRNSNPLVLIAMLILAPIAATLIRLAISRTREYDADQDGSALTGDPLALASALKKIEAGVAARPLPQDSRLENVAHFMIANPFKGAGLARMFATHPPMDDRVARLQDMAANRGFIR